MFFGLDMDNIYLMQHLHPYRDNIKFLAPKLDFLYGLSFEAGILRDGRPLGIFLDFDLTSENVLNSAFDAQVYESNNYVTVVLKRVRKVVGHQVLFGASADEPYVYSVGFTTTPKTKIFLPLLHCNAHQGEPIDPRTSVDSRPTGVFIQVQGAKPVEAHPIGNSLRESAMYYSPARKDIGVRHASSLNFKPYSGFFLDIQYWINDNGKWS